MRETWVWSLGWEDPLEEWATHSSILVWRIPMDKGTWQSVGSQRVRHDWATKHSTGRRENNSFFRVKGTVSISLKLPLWHCKSASILLVVFLEGTRGRWRTCLCLVNARGKAVCLFPTWDAERLHDQRQGMLQLAPHWITSEPIWSLPPTLLFSDLGLGPSFQIREKLKMLCSDRMQKKTALERPGPRGCSEGWAKCTGPQGWSCEADRGRFLVRSGKFLFPSFLLLGLP